MSVMTYKPYPLFLFRAQPVSEITLMFGEVPTAGSTTPAPSVFLTFRFDGAGQNNVFPTAPIEVGAVRVAADKILYTQFTPRFP